VRSINRPATAIEPPPTAIVTIAAAMRQSRRARVEGRAREIDATFAAGSAATIRPTSIAGVARSAPRNARISATSLAHAAQLATCAATSANAAPPSRP
jgi:hypothetical protein